MTLDHFGTADLRDAVLAAWERSPARFREDANAEEDHARGYYRDRVVVELAQNAADAAARSGEPGRLLLRLSEEASGGATLVAANTGAALDAAGVASLASLRASAKRPAAQGATEPLNAAGPVTAADSGPGRRGRAPELVGRFGVGFAAVRSVSDDVAVVSGDRGVRFSVDAAREALAGVVGRSSALRAEVRARAGSLPVLRLPVPLRPVGTGEEELFVVPPGHSTAVVLRLRDAAAVTAVRAQLAAVGDALLLALPALGEITVETADGERTLADVGSRWVSVTRSGAVPPALLADRPVEERATASWSVTWAVPTTDGSAERADVASSAGAGELRVSGGVVHAPTPTDEPLTLPALLVASFPLDPSRRHVARGALADLVAREAGAAYAELALRVPQPLDLVPTGLPAGRLDAEVREAALEALRDAPLLAGRPGGDAVVVDGEVGEALVDALQPTGLGVVAVALRHRAAARLLGATTMSLADVVDALPSGLSAPQWYRLYDALAPSVDGDRAVREALAAILVPLADGTTTRGPRGLVVAGAHVPGLDALGLRVVHPDAAHPLLLRLGALAADDPLVLALPAVGTVARDATDDLLDTDVDPDAGWPEDVAALLVLVAGVAAAGGAGANPGLPGWLGDLPLPAEDGAWRPADELAWPGSWAAEHLDLALVDVPGGPAWEPLALATARALGVRERLVVRTVADHVTGLDAHLAGDDARGGPGHGGTRGGGTSHEPVPGWDEYDEYLTAVLGADRPVGDVLVVADLDVVHRDAWGAVVDALSEEPQARAALLTPVRAQDVPTTASGGAPAAVSYAAWYLRDVLRAPFVRPGADIDARLAVVLPDAPPALDGVADERVLSALGAIGTTAGLGEFLAAPDAAGWDAFWSGLPDPGTPVPTAVARAVWSALETAARGGLELDPLPERVVALQGAVARVVDAVDVAVAGAPMWAQVRAVVPVSDPALLDAVADALEAVVLDARAVSVRASDDARERAVPEVLALVLGIQDGEPALSGTTTPDRELPGGLPASWTLHDELAVDGRAVEWWVTADGAVHVSASPDPEASAARGLAQAAGRWASRHSIEVVLRDAARGPDLAAENAWAERPPRSAEAPGALRG